MLKFQSRRATWLSSLLIAISLSFASMPSAAQEATAPAVVAPATTDAASPIVANAKAKLDEATKALSEISGGVESNSDNDAELLALRTRADDILASNGKLNAEIRESLDGINSQLTALGEPPAEGASPEPEIVSTERKRLDTQKNELNAVLSELAAFNSSMTSVADNITALRRSLFTDTLLRRTEISPSLFLTAGTSFIVEIRSLGTVFSQWLGDVWSTKRLALTGAIALSLLAALLFLVGGYKVFGKRVDRDLVEGEPSYLTRLSVAFWSTLIQGVSVLLFIASSIILMRAFGLMNPRVDPIITTTLAAIGFVYFISRLTYAIFTPTKPNWRLLAVSNKGAHFLSSAIVLMAVINGADYVLDVISEVLSSSLVLTVAKGAIASILIAIILFAISLSRPIIGEGQDAETGNQPLRRWSIYLLRFAAIVLLLACLSGYIGLARFLSTQIVATGAVLALVYIGFLSGKAVARQGHFAQTAPGKSLQSRYKLGDVALDQLGLLVAFTVYAVAVFFGVPLILLSWGFQLGDIQGGIVKLFTGFSIGNFSISLISILTGFVIFALGYAFTRWFQRWLDSNILVRSQVDSGVRNSVRTGIGYVGIVLATIFGITSAGLDLSNLALVVSALSVGIGFGLQNIVQNFVSGVILLVERPFKVGDWVVAGTTEGHVKRLSVRATEIETFRGQTIIVPNSEFINSPVGNWTHRNRIQRSEIPIAVDYDSDPDQVISILLELARAQTFVLRNPEPLVEFVGFGDFTLNFELRFYVADLSNGLPTRNAVRTAILKRFKDEGIKFPFPTRELNVHLANRKSADLLQGGVGAGADTTVEAPHASGNPVKLKP
jgi:potassium efflux system protein